ncbi:MAG TPA: EAL domain-containing protein, partial [Lachnospiraceae bacterium]|nr:EAL domain-containing protein [Lachnospiraceae bacterium]
SSDDYKPVRSVLEKDAMHGGNVSCETKLLCRDGSLVEAEMSVRMAVYENVRFYYVVLINLTKSRRKEEILKKELSKYRFRASRDALTGIYNQETFFSETRKLVEKYPGERFVIGEWNIDRFKAINELFGSHAGDQIICAFADHLQRTYIEKCTYGRMESDHFVTCCPESFLEERSPEVEALLNGQMSWHTLNHPISLHAGFYRVEQGERDVAIMCDRAGMALQQIKDSFIQREKYFNDDLLEALVKEQQMMRDADAALNNKEFFVMYQPIIDVKTKKIVAAEALVRWKKRTGEIVPPGEFIPIFERNGFISKLDMYVWEEVCRYQGQRKAVGKKLVPISVNLSRIDFSARHGIPSVAQ